MFKYTVFLFSIKSEKSFIKTFLTTVTEGNRVQ